VRNGDVIVANLNREFVCKIIDIPRRLLLSSNQQHQPAIIHEYNEFTIEGVITRSIRYHCKSPLLSKKWMFVLVDANSLPQQVFLPDWHGKPVVVASNNDRMIVAANRQAKEVGIQKFVPYFQVKTLFAERGVIACSSNYELYADLSSKMMDIIDRFAPEQHAYSIYETFLSFKNCYPTIKCLNTQGQLIRRAVWKEARLPVCVGIAETLTLAKLANLAAKKIEGYKGLCVIDNDQDLIAILKQLAVGDVWGIGRRISAKLELMNIRTALTWRTCQQGSPVNSSALK